MIDRIPTIVVKAQNKWGYRIINADAFDPAVHEEFDPDAVDAPEAPTTLPGENVPADWRSLHWKRQVALAKQLTGETPATAAEAAALIANHIAAANAAQTED